MLGDNEEKGMKRMLLTPITLNADEYPAALTPFISGAKLYDSSCSAGARVIYIDKGDGYFLKSAPLGKLKREAAMTRYFHTKGLAAEVIAYITDGAEHKPTQATLSLPNSLQPTSSQPLPSSHQLLSFPPTHSRDWLLTAKLRGDDCTAAKYLEQPERLCDILAERLAMLHGLPYAHCPIQNHTIRYLSNAEWKMQTGEYDNSHFPDSFGYRSAEEAWAVVAMRSNTLRSDTLLHGDYCLPNIILDDGRFSGFIDLDSAGVGDRHVDIFWALWSLAFNLKTDKYRDRFIDAYGRDRVDEGMLRVVAAVEVFG
jgi:kanamycin kinase